MNYHSALKEYKRIKRNRKRVERFGDILIGLGLITLLVISGERSTLSLLQTVLIGIGGCIFMLLGAFITKYVRVINEEYPVSIEMVEKGDSWCYNVNIIKQKESV